MNHNLRISSISDILQKQAQARPDKVCLLYPNQTELHTYSKLTYKQFDQVTNHLAQKFTTQMSQNLMKENPVICLLANSDVNYLLTIYAFLKMDVIVFPLSIRNSAAATMHLLDNSNVSYLWYSKHFSTMAEKVRTKFGSKIGLHLLEEIHIEDIVTYGESTFIPTFNIDEPDRIRMILHSSGSTSYPKPVRLNTRCLCGYFECYSLKNKDLWTDNDTVLSLLPLMFNVGGTYALPLTVSFPPSPKEVLTSIQHSKSTILSTVPVFLEKLLPLLGQDDNIGFQMLARLKFISCGGAACPPDVGKQLTEQGVTLVMAYGSTETGFLLVSEYNTANKDQWNRLQPMVTREPNMKFLPTEPNSNIHELFILPTDPFLAPDFTKNGPYSPGDLFLAGPPGSGYYIIQGRKDDILVHVTGEKSNALPMELVIQQHRIVDHAVVLGHNRLCCSALIQLNIEEAFKYELREIEEQVLIAVKAANKDAPSHSQIASSLVKILPMSKHLPLTAKGTVNRKLAELEYKDMIEQMYEHFLNLPKTESYIHSSCQRHSWTRDSMCTYLQSTVAQVLNKPVEIFADYSKSLHSLSLDSLAAVNLRNILCLEFGQLDQNIIFEFPCIDDLADELLRIKNNQQVRTSNDPLHYKETEEIIDKYINLMEMYKEQLIMVSEKISNNLDSNTSSKRIVLITGANGSLGSQILLHLMKKPQVKRVYCLVRGENAIDKLHRAMQARKQDSTVLLDKDRIRILSMDLSDEKLGQTATIYDQLQHEITDIIHSAWKMDFNMTIKDFDRECLQGLYHLLKFAAGTSTQSPMHFHFISSITSAGSGLIEEIKEEPLPRRIGISLAQGYAQSKYAGEHICWAAMDRWGVPVDIYRVGQIAGDSETGVWNTTEMISLMICAGGGQLGVLPEHYQRINWIPVNYSAASISDIAIDVITRTATRSERVHHILNPHTISWSQLLEHLKSAGLQFAVVPTKDWLSMLLASPKNPAYTLAGFFEKFFAEGKDFEFAKYRIEKSVDRTMALKSCPSIDQRLIQRYLNYWSEVGFLKYGYTSTP